MKTSTVKGFHISLLLLVQLLLQLPLISRASCSCQLPQQNETTPLTERRVPPNYWMPAYNYVYLQGIRQGLDYHSLTDIYIYVLENTQFLNLFKQQLSTRLGGDVVPPDSHCFVSERTALTFIETNASRFTDQLVDDLCMMVNLNTSLTWAVRYERENHGNQYAFCLASIKYSIEVVIEALSNITNVPVDHCRSSQGGADSNGGSDENDEDDVTYNSRDRNVIPRGNNDFGEQSHAPDSFDGQESTQSLLGTNAQRILSLQGAGAATSNCGAITSDEQQFVYVYEAWVGLWYLRNDLLPMKDHYAS